MNAISHKWNKCKNVIVSSKFKSCELDPGELDSNSESCLDKTLPQMISLKRFNCPSSSKEKILGLLWFNSTQCNLRKT